MIYIGIDPGMKGAVGAVTAGGEVILCSDVPTISNGKSREYNIPAMAEMLINTCMKQSLVKSLVTLERAQAMPGQGVSSMFNFGRGYGIWLGILGAIGIPYITVQPSVWARTVLKGMPGKGKARSIQYVLERFPTAELIPEGCKRPKDGRADAVCLAQYGRMTSKQVP